MYDNATEKNEEIEIDLQRLFNALMKRAWVIAIAAVIGAVLTFVGTFLFITPKYQASAMFYVNNNSLSLGEASLSITSADISASKSLVNSYIVILNTRESLNDVIDYAGVNRTYSQIKRMISAEPVSSTEIFRVVVTSEDPQEAETIADAIAYVLPKRIGSIIEGTSAKVVDAAVLPTQSSSPNYTKNTMIGFVVGLALAAAVIILRELLDISIHKEEDIAQCGRYPVLASVPDMHTTPKGGYYGYGQAINPKTGGKGKKGPVLVGGNISFAAAEAYKLLRTKLLFSFADEKDCHVIGISSAMPGEGKSLTSINVAYSMAQLGKRVLLIDCDLRRPSLTEKLPINKIPGLSDYLAGISTADNLVQVCSLMQDTYVFHVIAPGRIPPNPLELLSSAKMEKMLERLQSTYDYIILDLPPVGEVSDALAIAKNTDGILLVVRQNYCDRIALNTAVRQFEFVDAKLLGTIFNCTAEDSSGYKRKYYKRSYYGKQKSKQG